jgi:hypothetical protein
MRTRFSMAYRRAASPVLERQAKFGGQPNWVGPPAWPLSSALGTPMMFVCQFALPQEIVGEELAGRMAYFFLTDELDAKGRYVGGGALNDGESAVIVQPGEPPAGVKTSTDREGPALKYYDPRGPVDSAGRLSRVVYPEYVVTLTRGEDPDYVPESVLWGWEDMEKGGWPESQRNAYYSAVEGDKIGGTPWYLHPSDNLPPSEWLFLMQFANLPDPCVNLADCGIGYVFLSHDGRRSQFIVQSH